MKDCREDALERSLRQTIAQHDLASRRELIECLAAKLNVSILDCAAALLYLKSPMSSPSINTESKIDHRPKTNYRFVRYRLDAGSQHHVNKEQIQAILVEESGVDKKRIGRIDIRHSYTLVELPDGMPADIFQLLTEAMIGDRKLAIKRVKPNRRRLRETKG